MVGYAHTVRVHSADWITVEDTHEGIITREEFDLAQATLRAFTEHWEINRLDRPLHGKVRCGVCGYAMQYIIKGKNKKMYYCRTPRSNSAYTCTGRTPEADILEMVSEGLRMQALTAVELQRLWEEKHRVKKKDIAAVKKTLSGLRETHGQLCRHINALYESFALGEIGKPEYLSAKVAAVKQRDRTAARIAELEAALENTGVDGSLQNGFTVTFGKYTEVEEITSEIIAEVLEDVYIYPDGRLEIVWKLRDELERLTLDLQEEPPR